MDIMKYFILWAVLCGISFVGDTIIVLNVALQPRLWSHYFQLLSVLLAITDMVHSIAWFMGDGYGTFWYCSIQEYMFQGSNSCRAGLTVVICDVVCQVVFKMTLPTPKEFALILLKWLAFPLISLCISIYFKSSRFFCSGQFEIDPNERSPSSNRAVDAFALAFLLPMAICITADIVYYVIIHRRLALLNSPDRLHTSVDRDHALRLHSLVDKLKIYPLVLVVCWFFEVAMLSLGSISNRFAVNSTYYFLSTLGVCLTGIALSGVYFLHQGTYHPLIYWCFDAIFGARNLGIQCADINDSRLALFQGLLEREQLQSIDFGTSFFSLDSHAERLLSDDESNSTAEGYIASATSRSSA